jgi:hypothetical protein
MEYDFFDIYAQGYCGAEYGRKRFGSGEGLSKS